MNILLAHGSSDHRHVEQVKELAENVSSLLNEEVDCAYLSDENLPTGATVLPLFLGAGKHVREDIPVLVKKSDCTLLPGLNNQTVAEFVISELSRENRRIHALFAVYRFAGFEQLTTALYGKMKIFSKHALASMHSEPSVANVIAHWREEGVEKITLQPMLLFEGKSMDIVRTMTAEHNITLAPAVSEYDGFAELVANSFKVKQ